MPLVISFISAFIRGAALVLRKAEGHQPVDEILEDAEFETCPVMSSQAALQAEITAQLAFTRSLLSLSTVCAPNPYGRLAAEATPHEASKSLKPGSAS
jgi:hypothetical protein